MKTFLILVINGLFFWSNISNAQSIERSVIASMGASVQSGNLQLDYTVGETAVSTLTNSSLTLTQGFHQGELQTTGLNGLPARVTYQVYPNPASRELSIAMDGPQLDFWILLYNAAGQPVEGIRRQVKAAGHWQDRLDLSRQTPGVYFLVITDERGKWLQAHRVVKI